MKDAVRFGFYSHTRTKLTSACDGIASHCTRLGFGNCSNEHNGQCSACAPAFFGPRKLAKLVDKLLSAMIAADPSARLAVPSRGESPDIYDELVSMKSALAIISVRLKHYHCHVLRGRWQQDFIANVIANLIEGELVVVFDFMMKVGAFLAESKDLMLTTICCRCCR